MKESKSTKALVEEMVRLQDVLKAQRGLIEELKEQVREYRNYILKEMAR